MDATLLVAKNKRRWPGLNKTVKLKEGTDLSLPSAGETLESILEEGKEAHADALERSRGRRFRVSGVGIRV